MRDEPRSLDVLQEPDTQPDAFVSAFDQAWNVGNDERAALARGRVGIGGNDAQVRLERGERISRDLGPRRGDARDQCRLSCVREADQADIGEQFQFQAQTALFAGTSLFVFTRRLVPGPYEMRVAVSAPTASTSSRAESLARLGKIEKLFPGNCLIHDGADRNSENQVSARSPVAVRALAVTSAVGVKFAIVTVAQKRVVVRVRFEVNVTPMPTVSARGAAPRNVLLSAEGHAAVSAVAAFYDDLRFVNEHELLAQAECPMDRAYARGREERQRLERERNRRPGGTS